MASGARYKGRDDVLLVELDKAARIAGVFTRSKMPSAAVDLSRAHLAATKGRARAILVNAGNANCFYRRGRRQSGGADGSGGGPKIGCAPHDVLVASTGVIGEVLETAPLLKALEKADGMADWQAAARAIMTTDTFPKLASASAKFGNQTVTLTGIAKGSGMIAPDMATMLAFVFTDAALPVGVLKKLLSAPMLTVSTASPLMATPQPRIRVCWSPPAKPINGAAIKSADDKRLAAFKKALSRLMQDLAQQVARDGEGITKLMTIEVSGAENNAAARKLRWPLAIRLW